MYINCKYFNVFDLFLKTPQNVKLHLFICCCCCFWTVGQCLHPMFLIFVSHMAPVEHQHAPAEQVPLRCMGILIDSFSRYMA